MARWRSSAKHMPKGEKHVYCCSKFSLHKNFKLVLNQNVTFKAYPQISSTSQKCQIQSQNQQLYFVN